MAGQDRVTIEEVVRQVLRDEHADVIRESVKAMVQELMEVEISELIGAERGERRPEDRATHRNGYRPRRWDTSAGEIELQIPKSARAATSRRFCSPGSARSRRSSAWCRRPTSVASRRAASTTSSRASACGSQRARSGGSLACSTSKSKRSGSARWRAATSRRWINSTSSSLSVAVSTWSMCCCSTRSIARRATGAIRDTSPPGHPEVLTMLAAVGVVSWASSSAARADASVADASSPSSGPRRGAGLGGRVQR